MVKVSKTSRLPGEPVQALDLFTRAWDECIELQCNPKDVWVGRALLSLADQHRWELIAFDGAECLGGIVVVQELDIHVGQCLSVVAQYVLPEHRLTGVSPQLMRGAMRIAREAGAPTFAFTHRKGPWRYETIYRSLS